MLVKARPWIALTAFLAASLLAAACAAPSAPPAKPAAPAATTAPPAASKPAASATSAPAAAAPAATAPPSAAPLSPPATVRMGVLGILAESGVYIAEERGYFAEEGIVPEFTVLDTGARAIPGLATGQLDVTGGNFSPSYVNAALRGVGMKMVAGLLRNDTGGSGSFVLLRKELADRGVVRDWPDLRGRVVAVPARASVNDYTLARGLERGGLTLADVDLVELSFPDTIPALANGNIDAGMSTEPLSSLAAERGVAIKWKDNGEYLPGVTPAVMSYGPAFMESQPEAARRWMVAYLRGARDFNAAFKHGVGRAEIVQVLVKHTTVKDPTMYDRMGIGIVDPNGWLNLANIADQAAWYGEQGYLQGTIDVSTLVDPRWVDAALARLGPSQQP